MKDWFNDIVDFHNKVMGDYFKEFPHIPEKKYRQLRKALIKEEISETLTAIDELNMIEIADGIVDSIVVLIGTAVTFGIDIRPIWDIVHKTNMDKVRGETRSDGKKLKPVDWISPKEDIRNEIGEQIRKGIFKR